MTSACTTGLLLISFPRTIGKSAPEGWGILHNRYRRGTGVKEGGRTSFAQSEVILVCGHRGDIMQQVMQFWISLVKWALMSALEHLLTVPWDWSQVLPTECFYCEASLTFVWLMESSVLWFFSPQQVCCQLGQTTHSISFHECQIWPREDFSPFCNVVGLYEISFKPFKSSPPRSLLHL